MHQSSSARHAAPSLLLVLALAGTSFAQGTCFEITAAKVGGNVIPFGNNSTSASWVNQKYQSIVLPGDLNNTTGAITSIAFGASTAATHTHTKLTIRMAHSLGTGPTDLTLSTTFAANMVTNPATVFEQTDFVWHKKAGQWARIGLQKPYTYIPALGRLIIEVTAEGNFATVGSGSNWSGTRPRLYATGTTWVNGQPPATGTFGTTAGLDVQVCFGDQDLSVYGAGCKGSNSLVPAIGLTGSAGIGQKVGVSLANGPASSPTFLVVGVTPYNQVVELGIAGAPGCRLYFSQDILVGAPTDASGAIATAFTTPNDKLLVGLNVYVQFAPFDKGANNLGLSFSDYGRILIGL